MRKIIKYIMVSAIVLMLIAPAVSATRGGLTPGYWKRHQDEWNTYTPSTLLTDVFTIPDRPGFDFFDGKTFINALRFHGGKGIVGMARILFRSAIAGLLNAENDDPDWHYLYSSSYIIGHVNSDLTWDRDHMESFKDVLDDENNLGTP